MSNRIYIKDVIKGVIKNTRFQIKRYPDYYLTRRILMFFKETKINFTQKVLHSEIYN